MKDPGMIRSSSQWWFTSLLAVALVAPAVVYGQQGESWRTPYAGKDAQGPHVLGFWRFESGKEKDDSSSHGQSLAFAGTEFHAAGKFGACLECFPAVTDVKHSATVANNPRLSANGPFSIEMWVQPKPEFQTHPQHVFLLDKKYVSHQDYQLIFDAPQKDGSRSLRVVLGFGTDSETWRTDETLKLEPGTWTHLAMTYDAAGTVQFFVNGVPAGGGFKTGRGGVAPGTRALTIGDRGGSSYAGFPGFIDEVRLTSGVREFRTMSLEDDNRRHVFLRNEPAPPLKYRIVNLQRGPLENLEASVTVPHGDPVSVKVKRVEPGADFELTVPVNTALRPDRYEFEVRVQAVTEAGPVTTIERTPVQIVPRQSPYRMPVVMWGLGGIDEGLSKSFGQLKQLGFTHCLGLTCDYSTVWKEGKPIPATTPAAIKSSDRVLDTALAEDVGIIVSLSPGRIAENRPELRRVDRNGKETGRENLANLSPDLETYFYNVGASVAQTWGSHPALRAALVDTEIRDGTAPSFHPQERKAFKDFAGYDIPEEVQTTRGVSWTKLKDFPANRIIPADNPILNYYRWFWKTGDGWNSWHSALHRGFHSADDKRPAGDPLWTFFDPAVRAPSVYGSGGDVDYLSHWTYTYPDPIRIGLCTDELFTMAGGSTRKSPQQVMKMTQLIWYRSQTAASQKSANPVERSPWEDFDPDAAYITIAPMHLREALWMKLSRPVQGIMYHGWGSLVPGQKSSYRYTHPDTQEELARLMKTVVEPLGPALRQIPAAPAEVALLESFTSQMFAARGTYGWGSGWGADCWHVLQYAHLPTEILYEETVLEKGLDQYRVLVLPDCDVLTQPVADAIQKFQKRGGIVVGDTRLAPGVKADIVLTPYARQRKSDVDQAKLMELAGELTQKLKGKYQSPISADQSDVIVQRRQAGEVTYLFAINDRREFGDYVGQYGLVMENGKPASATLSLQQPTGHVYDLRRHLPVTTRQEKGRMQWQVNLAPADGALFLISPRPIEQLQIEAAEQSSPGKRLPVTVRIADRAGKKIDAVVPLQVEILDPNGRTAEFSGYHATAGGELTLPLDIAVNDARGIWTVTVKEFATGQTSQKFIAIR